MAIDNSTKFGIVKTTKDKITTSSMNEGKLYVALDNSLGGGIYLKDNSNIYNIGIGNAYTKNETDSLLNLKFDKSGGTLTGSIYPDKTDTINLGNINNRFASVAVGQIRGFINVKNETFKSNWLQPGLSVIANIAPTNGDGTYADYGLPAFGSGAEGGIINFRTVNAPAANSHYHLHQLGFDRTGIYWRNTTDNANQSWKCLSSPSIFESAVPNVYEYSSNPKFIPELRNGNIINVFHKILQNNLTIERSQDGSTWTDTTETEWEAFSQIMTEGLGATTQCVAYDGSTGKVGDRLRITINGAQAYSYLSHLYIYYSTVGNTTKLTVERNGYGDQDNWRTVINKQPVQGWSGPNYYGLNNQLIGRAADNSGYSWRLTFEITAVNASYNSKGEISKIYCFSSQTPWAIAVNPTVDWYYHVAEGGFISNYSIRPRWNVSSSLGTNEYKWTNVYANKFIGNLQGNADNATNDSSGRKIVDTYATKAEIQNSEVCWEFI